MSVTLADRLASLEKQNIAYDLLLRTLEKQDTATAHAVQTLTDTIKDPETGLIVQVRELRNAVASNNKRLFVAIGGLIALAQLFAPYLPVILRTVLGLPTPTP